MKKHYFFLLFILFSFSCDNPLDCVTGNGDLISKTFSFQDFDIIKVNPGIKLVIKQGQNFEVTATIGSNFENDLQISQTNKILTLSSNSSCNWVRNYGTITVFITTPTLQEIHSKTAKDILSNGILNFPILRLIAFEDATSSGTNDFTLQLQTSQLVIESNSNSRFFLSGTTQTANFNYYNGDARIEAQNLVIQNLQIYHRGSNDMVVFPVQSITGTMVSTGNVILKNNPPMVNVQQLYQGQVIYN